MTRRLLPFLVAVALVAPRTASAFVSIEGFYGLSHPKSPSFSAAVSGTVNNPDLLASSLNIAGGNVIFHLGTFEAGAILDTSWKSGSASQTALGGLLGIGGDIDKVWRLELLGEIGGQRYGNFAENPNIVTSSSSSEWFMYLGLRPGIAYRFGAPDSMGFLVGIWGFARWDLTTSNVPVTVSSASATAPGTIKLGGTTIGATLRLGIDF